MGKVFLKRNDVYSLTESNFTVQDTLDKGIYKIEQNPDSGELYLVKQSVEFYFDFKLYGVDKRLVKHVIDTYEKQPYKKNLGVLLNGAKGTGKTVTAKLLCNKLNLPVIICDVPYNKLKDLIISINQDCIFFFDEFEKNFRMNDKNNENCAGENLLSIMDGVFNSEYCHIFILTTNELSINNNLISRPSRIRYLKSFGNVIDKKIIEEYIKDNLNYPEKYDEIIDFIESLSIATIDIVKSIVDEINIHNCSINDFKDIFNVEQASYFYYSRYIFCESNDNLTKEEFLRKKNKIDELNFYYRTLKLKKSLKEYKVGDYINGDIIIDIDEKNNFLGLKCICNNTRSYYDIYNFNDKPSVFNNNYDYNEYDN